MDIGSLLGKIVQQNTSLFLRYGVVSAVTSSPNRVSIKLSGSQTAVVGIRYLASYSPTVSDVVVCLVSDSDVIVLGKLA
jgi:hypothetical protein